MIHYEKVDDVPAGARSVLVKYLLERPAAACDACSLYAVRMEANYKPADAAFKPLEVTFTWNEAQDDYTTRRSAATRSWSTSCPARYTINVGGADHPVDGVAARQPQGRQAAADAPADATATATARTSAARSSSDRWVTVGKNLADGQALHAPRCRRAHNWGAGDPEGKKLTDGIVGSHLHRRHGLHATASIYDAEDEAGDHGRPRQGRRRAARSASRSAAIQSGTPSRARSRTRSRC